MLPAVLETLIILASVVAIALGIARSGQKRSVPDKPVAKGAPNSDTMFNNPASGAGQITVPEAASKQAIGHSAKIKNSEIESATLSGNSG